MAKSRVFLFLVIILLLSFLSYFYPQIQELTGQVTKQSTQNYEKETAILERVIDGDTIELDNGEHVRLLGINTPEKKMPLANLSRNFLEQFVGEEIYLIADKDNLDKYNRKIRYIFYDERFLNLEILEQGFANAYYTDGLKYKTQLLNAESQARELELGIWEKSQDKCASCITLNTLDYEKEFFIIENTCYFDCNLEKWFVKDKGRNLIYLNAIKANQLGQYNSTKDIWNNEGDSLFIFDKQGKLVLYYSY